MSSNDSRYLIILIGLFGIAVPLAAHHSFSAEFDLDKPFFMDGRVTRVEWVNPHVEVFIDVTDKQGKTVNWGIEMTPPYSMLRDGWKKDTFKPGMDVCVEGFPEKTGKPRFGSTAVQLKSTGQTMKTPPGNWMPVGQSLGNFSVGTPPEIVYTGKTSCTNRG